MRHSLTHKSLVPLAIGIIPPIAFAVAPQFPWVKGFNLSHRKPLNLHSEQHPSFFLAKHMIGIPFTPFLRFASAIRANRCSFFASTHIAYNVVSSRSSLLRHSVKHYEAVDEYVFMIQ